MGQSADGVCRLPGSAYVIIPTLSAGNPCTEIAVQTSLTFTFSSGQLSTVRGARQLVTSVFDFADIPCPPEPVSKDYEQMYHIYAQYSNYSKTYAPFIAPFPELYSVDPRFQYCTVAAYQGVDPPKPLPTATGGPTPPDFTHGRHGPPHRRAMNAHVVPQGPKATNWFGRN